MTLANYLYSLVYSDTYLKNDCDYSGAHGIGDPIVPNTPHVHFEFLAPPNPGGNKLRVIKNVHIPLKKGGSWSNS